MKSTWFSISVLLIAGTAAGGHALAQSAALAAETNTQGTVGGGSQDLAEVIVTAGLPMLTTPVKSSMRSS